MDELERSAGCNILLIPALIDTRGMAWLEAEQISSFVGQRGLECFNFLLLTVRKCGNHPPDGTNTGAELAELKQCFLGSDSPVCRMNECGSFSVKDERDMDTELVELRRKIQSAQFVKNAMTLRLEQYETELVLCRDMLSALSEADKLAAEAGLGDFSSAATSVMEKGKEVAKLDREYVAMEKV